MVDWANYSFEAAASHFQAASKSDPKLGLARAMYAFIGGQITGELTQPQALAEADRAVSDAAAHGNTNELLLATAYREALRGQRAAGNSSERAHCDAAR